MSDRVAVTRLGRIEQVGSPDDLYERPRTRFVADVIGESNVLSATVAEADGATVTLRLARGALVRVPAGPPEARGAPAALVVRPEKMVFLEEAADSWNRLTGHVREVIYMGETTKYVVGVGDELVRVKQQNRLTLLSKAFPGDFAVVGNDDAVRVRCTKRPPTYPPPSASMATAGSTA